MRICGVGQRWIELSNLAGVSRGGWWQRWCVRLSRGACAQNPQTALQKRHTQVYIYICIFIYIYIYIYVYIYDIYIYIYTCIYVYTCTCINVYIWQKSLSHRKTFLLARSIMLVCRFVKEAVCIESTRTTLHRCHTQVCSSKVSFQGRYFSLFFTGSFSGVCDGHWRPAHKIYPLHTPGASHSNMWQNILFLCIS